MPFQIVCCCIGFTLSDHLSLDHYHLAAGACITAGCGVLYQMLGQALLCQLSLVCKASPRCLQN